MANFHESFLVDGLQTDKGKAKIKPINELLVPVNNNVGNKITIDIDSSRSEIIKYCLYKTNKTNDIYMDIDTSNPDVMRLMSPI